VLYLHDVRHGQRRLQLMLDAKFWNSIHEAVQGELAMIANDVAAELPGIKHKTGKTQGRKFDLFSYMTFFDPLAPDSDLVTVGVSFAKRDDHFLISGDVYRDEYAPGIMYTAEHGVYGPAMQDPLVILREAVSVATSLVLNSDSVIGALRNSGQTR
jgi:hypothetical protein